MYFFDEVQIPQFTTSTPIRTWSFAGYKEFALYYWFSGQPGSVVYMEMYFNQYSGAVETINLSSGGLAFAGKLYSLFAPNAGVVLYNPSASMHGLIRVYAACCPQPPSLLANALPFLRPRAQARVISDEVPGFDPQTFRPGAASRD